MLDLGFEVVRTDRSLGQVLSSVVLDGDEVAFAVPVPEPAAVGHRLRILDVRGRVTSFGGEDPVDPGPQMHRFVVAGDEETFWAVRQQANRLVRWNLEPEPAVARVYDRTVEPFERDNPATQIWPRALNVGAMLDEDGLWIAWQTPDSEWTDRISPGGEIPEVPWQTVLDGWLDLVDPSTGRTLARYRGTTRCSASRMDRGTWWRITSRTWVERTSTCWNRSCRGGSLGRAVKSTVISIMESVVDSMGGYVVRPTLSSPHAAPASPPPFSPPARPPR